LTLQINVRKDVENNVLNILNRGSDPSMTALVQTWFYTAHKALQRLHNFRCMEATSFVPLIGPVGTTLGITRYPVPPDLKKSRVAYQIDPSTGFIVRFFEETSIETIRQNRWYTSPNSPEWPFGTDSDPNLNLPGQRQITSKSSKFAIWNDTIEIDPAPGITDNANYFQLDYYRWLLPPAENSFDWFTIHAFDYLTYRSLIEYAQASGGDTRLPMWQALVTSSWSEVRNPDVDASNSGELVMRG